MNKATPEEKKRLISNQKIMDKNKELIEELREWERKNEEWMEEGHKSRRMPQHLMRIKRLTATMDALIEKGLPLKAERRNNITTQGFVIAPPLYNRVVLVQLVIRYG